MLRSSQRKKRLMEFEKIRNLSDDELRSQEAKSAEQLFRLRFQKSLGNNEGVKKLRGLKLDIARIKTVARQRELAARNGGSAAQSAPVAKAKKPAVKTAAKSRTTKPGTRSAARSTAKPAAAAKTRTKAKKD